MKRLPRHIIACLLALIFLAITLSPLAGIGMHSPVIAHAITGECSGDCDTCGCSEERRATRTCCCWFKKLDENQNYRRKLAGHCQKTKKCKTSSVTRSCPCGGGKHLAMSGNDELKILPYHFDGEIALPLEEPLHHPTAVRLVDRNLKPPVPPPEFFILL